MLDVFFGLRAMADLEMPDNSTRPASDKIHVIADREYDGVHRLWIETSERHHGAQQRGHGTVSNVSQGV